MTSPKILLHRERSFGVIWVRVSDRKSLGSCCIQETHESTLVTDSLVPLMNYDPSDFGSLILIQITPKERSQMSICMMPVCGRSPYMEHVPMQRCSSIVKFLVFCVFSQSTVVFNTSPVKA